MTKFLRLFFFALLLSSAQSSLVAQTLRGIIHDADNGEPVMGATINIRFSRGGAAPNSLASSPSGEFVFEKIRPGYYTVDILAQGYENQSITEINVTSGKEQVLDIALHRSNAQLAEVTISAPQPGRRPVLPLGEIPLTRDQTQRFPAMYFDPARLAAAYPGVAQVDDGTNVLSIRGNSPTSVRWRLEGVDIVNPNHLPNAGTFSDRPASASGGVLMFSAQLLDNSSLLTSTMPAGYGDALGGVMDMNLRKGNARQHEFTAQAGLVGLDLAAEGPMFGKSASDNGDRKASYLANYRYSTVGLLGQLGVSFGDEQINFQDLSFNLHFDGQKGGRWSVFGLGGLSKNTFRHKTDSIEIKAYKDFFDIDFESKTGVIGVSNWSPLSKRTWIKTSLAVSSQASTRTANSTDYSTYNNSDDMGESKVSAAFMIAQRGKRAQFTFGANVLREHFEWSAVLGNFPSESTFVDYLLAQPWVQVSLNSKDKRTQANFGLHSLFLQSTRFDKENESSLEPRFSITRRIAHRQQISFAGGFYSQVNTPWFTANDENLLHSRSLELAYSWNFAPEWSFKTSIYRQWVLNVPFYTPEHFSVFNNSEFRSLSFFGNYISEHVRNDGVEVTVERRLSDGWFLLANAGISNSKIATADEAWRSTRWDIGHLANLTFGKEWQKEKSAGKEHTIGLNARAVLTGGIREADIDISASQAAHSTVYDERPGYYKQYPDYFRLDLRVYWRQNLGNRRNSTFALDIQNLTVNQNLSYHYYDPYTQKIENKFQLGPIPNFSWRLEF